MFSAMALPSLLTAQEIDGRVVDAATGEPIKQVNIQLLDEHGIARLQVVSGDSGGFKLPLPSPGWYRLRGDQLGYATVLSPQVQVGVGEVVQVELRMAVNPVELEPLVVKKRQVHDVGRLAEFYDRMDRNRKLGIGAFVTRDQIEMRHAGTAADYLREIPRVIVRSHGGLQTVRFQGPQGACAPRIVMDGVELHGDAELNDVVAAGDLEGIEVYRGRAEMPAAYYDETGCGIIVAWTRRGTDEGHPFRWVNMGIWVVLAAGLYLLGR
ncbi:MAG TPA: TonB-dependent receptor [Longimicrobiales bacterium]|nr:TonB-dependent receptor [Longimicrobiales bacterium]